MANLLFEATYNIPITGTAAEMQDNVDSAICCFANNNKQIENMQAPENLANYSSKVFSYFDQVLTYADVQDYGTIGVPHVGPCGFYTVDGADHSTVVIPMITKYKKYDMPIVECMLSFGSLVICIDTPSSITYECYRVVIKSDTQCNEYVIYANELIAPIPVGIFTIFVYGYYDEVVTSKEYALVATALAVGAYAHYLYNKIDLTNGGVPNVNIANKNVLSLISADSTINGIQFKNVIRLLNSAEINTQAFYDIYINADKAYSAILYWGLYAYYGSDGVNIDLNGTRIVTATGDMQKRFTAITLNAGTNKITVAYHKSTAYMDKLDVVYIYGIV